MVALGCLAKPAQAGTIGFPVASLPQWHFRFELLGDSFKEKLQNGTDVEAETGRALATAAFALTNWSEIYARFGMAEFQVKEDLFNGNFGFAYGGGIRLRVFSFPLGTLGVTAQYLRFTSDDSDSAGVPRDGEWEEFDVAAGIGTKRFGVFQFYAGGVFHHSDVVIDGGGSPRVSLEPEIPFRLLLGANIYPIADFPGGDFIVNFEARVIGEIPQFTIGVQYVF